MTTKINMITNATVNGGAILIEILATSTRVTKTRHLDFFKWELIVVRQLVATTYVTQRKNDDVQTCFDDDLSRVAVRFTRVVNEPRNVAALCGVDHHVVATTKHVAASDSLLVVLGFTHVGHRRTNHFAGVLHQHFTRADIVNTEESNTMNFWPMNRHSLAAEFTQLAKPHRHWKITHFRPPENKSPPRSFSTFQFTALPSCKAEVATCCQYSVVRQWGHEQSSCVTEYQHKTFAQ